MANGGRHAGRVGAAVAEMETAVEAATAEQEAKLDSKLEALEQKLDSVWDELERKERPGAGDSATTEELKRLDEASFEQIQALINDIESDWKEDFGETILDDLKRIMDHEVKLANAKNGEEVVDEEFDKWWASQNVQLIDEDEEYDDGEEDGTLGHPIAEIEEHHFADCKDEDLDLEDALEDVREITEDSKDGVFVLNFIPSNKSKTAAARAFQQSSRSIEELIKYDKVQKVVDAPQKELAQTEELLQETWNSLSRNPSVLHDQKTGVVQSMHEELVALAEESKPGTPSLLERALTPPEE